VVLEQLKRDELKRKSTEPKKWRYFHFFLQDFSFLQAFLVLAIFSVEFL
jgi:hypothetical protein